MRSSLSSLELDFQGQLPSLRVYTQLAITYVLPPSRESDVNVAQLEQTVRAGLVRLARVVPWTTGVVSAEGQSGNCSGRYHLVWNEDQPAGERVNLCVRDARGKCPVSGLTPLPEELVCPQATLPSSKDGPEHALLTQLTILDRAVVLTVLTSHATADIIGHVTLMRWLDLCCRDQPIPADELATSRLNRADVVPLLPKDWMPGSEMAFPAESTSDAVPCDLPTPRQGVDQVGNWTLFRFQPQDLDELKGTAAASLGGTADWISTDDALTALIWTSLTRVRVECGERSLIQHVKEGRPIFLSRAVDMRWAFTVSESYPGLLTLLLVDALPLDRLLSAPLGEVAGRLRAKLREQGLLAQRTRGWATVVARTPERESMGLLGPVDASKGDVLVSSWTKADTVWRLTMGLGLGQPQAVWRPAFAPIPGLVYLLLRAPNGNVDVTLCLNRDELAALCANPTWARAAVPSEDTA